MGGLIFIFTIFSFVSLSSFAITGEIQAESMTECDISINGERANANTIKLHAKDGVSVRGKTHDDVIQNNVYLHIFGKRIFLTSLSSTNGSFQGNARIPQISNIGVGLYELTWDSVNSDGKVLCQVRGNIQILGSPVKNVAGIIALSILCLGILGFAVTLRRNPLYAYIKRNNYVKSGSICSDKTDRIVEFNSNANQTLRSLHIAVGVFSGFFIGAGSLIILQQLSITSHSLDTLVYLVMPCTLLGLLSAVTSRISH